MSVSPRGAATAVAGGCAYTGAAMARSDIVLMTASRERRNPAPGRGRGLFGSCAATWARAISKANSSGLLDLLLFESSNPP